MAIGFAFLPAGLKKLVGEPFTDPSNQGTFHEFLHAFHATGFFYQFVGLVQLLAAAMLITHVLPTVGALLITPVLTAIFVFCWSTKVIPTATVVTMMLLGVIGLLLWDWHKWQSLFGQSTASLQAEVHPRIEIKIWRIAGFLILGIYFAEFLIRGEVYRPRGAEWSNPSFILLNLMALIPVVACLVDYRRNAN